MTVCAENKASICLQVKAVNDFMTQQQDEVGNTSHIVQFALRVDFCALGVIDFPSNFPAGSPTQGFGC